MEASDFIKRIEDLAERCERTGSVTSTAFLTPAELFELRKWLNAHPDTACLLSGGAPDCERQAAFFLPWFLPAEELNLSERIKAVCLQGCFGTPGHRDYLGALMGLGIKREWLGDLQLEGDRAYLFCLPSVLPSVLQLERAGRITVKAREIPLSEVPAIERKVKQLSFTVKSLRLDAVTGELFSLSRSKAQEALALGLVSLNYEVCLKPDAEVREGDVISLRGKGKGQLTAIGGRSKKDRLFLEADRFL